MTTLENWHFCVELGFGSDLWRLSGNVYNHPNFADGAIVFPSSINSFDKARMQIITESGRKYQLGQFKQLTPVWPIEKTIEEIEKCVGVGFKIV